MSGSTKRTFRTAGHVGTTADAAPVDETAPDGVDARTDARPGARPGARATKGRATLASVPPAPAETAVDERTAVAAPVVPGIDPSFASRQLEAAVLALASADRKAAEKREACMRAIGYAGAAGITSDVVRARLIVAGVDADALLGDE